MAYPEQFIADILTRVLEKIAGNARVGQQEMVQAVWDCLQDDQALLVQAGTGTGKSLGYLVPLMVQVAHGGQRAVVSTATLALQRQIEQKDARLVQEVLAEDGYDISVAVLKGWHHYLCKQKILGGYPQDELPIDFADYNNEKDILPETEEFPVVTDLACNGLKNTNEQLKFSGQIRDKNETFSAQVRRLYQWAKNTLTGDRDDLVPGVSDRAWRNVSVTSRECLHEKCSLKNECFAYQARARADRADMVLTNHAMLGVECVSENSILPTHDYVVVDEAHALVDRVTSATGVTISDALLRRIEKSVRRLKLSVTQFSIAADSFRLALAQMPVGRHKPGEFPPVIGRAINALILETRELCSQVGKYKASAKEIAMVAVALADCDELLAALDTFGGAEIVVGTKVAWVEERAGERYLHAAMLEVAGEMAAHLWSDRAVILTSATLFPRGQEKNIAHSLGVGDKWQAIDVGTPFETAKQAILYVPRQEMPLVRQGVAQEVLKQMVSLVQASQGGALCLFTSLAAMQQAGQAIREQTNYQVYVQGEEQIPALVNAFAQDVHSCLVGTLSLWQGVDVPGLTNRLVIIDKIPFARPDDPIASARVELANITGGNGFMRVSVANAALLLTQGVGRLLRSAEDKGVVAVLDARLLTKRYGKLLLDSLPPMYFTSDLAVVSAALERLSATL